MESPPNDPQHDRPIAMRAAAFSSNAFMRVVHTGRHEQIAVMTVPPDNDSGDAVHPDMDHLVVVVDGTAEVRMGDVSLPVWTGDGIFIEAGTRHNIVNRAVVPLRLVTVYAPPAHLPGTVYCTKAEAEAAASSRQ